MTEKTTQVIQGIFFSIVNALLYCVTTMLYLSVQENIMYGQPHYGVFLFAIYFGGPIAFIGIVLSIWRTRFKKIEESMIGAYNYCFLFFLFLYQFKVLERMT